MDRNLPEQNSPFFTGKFSNQKKGSGTAVRRQFQQTNSITLLAIKFAAETLCTSFANCVKGAETDGDPEIDNYKQQLLRYLWIRDEILFELDARDLLHIQNQTLLLQSCLRHDRKYFPNDNLGIDESGKSVIEEPPGSGPGPGNGRDPSLPA